MFVVAVVRVAKGPYLGSTFSRETYEEAVDLATKLVLKELQGKDGVDEAEVRAGIEENGDYYDDEWSVCIGSLDEGEPE